MARFRLASLAAAATLLVAGTARAQVRLEILRESANPAGGGYPNTLVRATEGNFCGTVGNVLTPDGATTILHKFNSAEGIGPIALLQATDGNLYGVTEPDGAHGSNGTVFRMTPAGVLTTLHSLDGHVFAQSLTQATAEAAIDTDATTAPAPPQGPPAKAHWRAITTDSLRFLLVQHGSRIALRPRVRDALFGGPFFKDYWDTLTTRPRHFWDGNPWYTNLVGHPVQGSVSYRIARVNGAGRSEAFWWGVLYSTEFELGLLGEAAIGNIQTSPVDLVVTPTMGWAMGVAEEWLAARLPKRGERYWLITRPLLMGQVLTQSIARK